MNMIGDDFNKNNYDHQGYQLDLVLYDKCQKDIKLVMTWKIMDEDRFDINGHTRQEDAGEN